MRKTIVTILLTSLILYTVGMMTIFTPKAEALGLIGPFEVLDMCCEYGVRYCCAEDCTDRFCPSRASWCIVAHGSDIDQCTDNCADILFNYCWGMGYNTW